MKDVNETRFGKHFKLGFALSVLAFLGLAEWRPAGGQTTQGQATTSPATYTVTDLGTLGGTFALGAGISNKRWVNGLSTLQGDTQVRAFLWRKGVMGDLGTLEERTAFRSSHSTREAR